MVGTRSRVNRGSTSDGQIRCSAFDGIRVQARPAQPRPQTLALRAVEFGRFLVRVPIARRANREQPRASALGKTRTRKSP
jgi:hypothetical protein